VLRSSALALLTTLTFAGTASAAGDPVMPLSDVSAGMQCTGYSVVKGTAISSFDVAVEDVVTGDAGERAPRILVRVSGPAVDATGIGPGFSGSPIYCPDADGVQRVIGAISESVGQYGNTVALATPIEAILGQPVEPPAAARSAPALVRAARPIATPLSIGGLSAPLATVVGRAAAQAGRPVTTVPAAPRGGFAPQPLVPGAAMAVGLASGDLTAGAVGTVAYADGDRIWAFGHPLDAVGRRSLLLQDAYVYAVIGNPLSTSDASTYKLAAAGHDVGTLSGDGASAVAGTLGALPARYPMRIVARDLDTGHLDVTNLQLADESAVGLPGGSSALSQIGPIAVAQGAFNALGSVPARQTASMCVRLEVRELRRPMRFCNNYVGPIGGGEDLAGAPMAADLASAAELLDAYDGAPLHISAVIADLKLRRGLSQAYLAAVSGPQVVRRGTTVRLRAIAQRVGGGMLVRTIRVHIPRSLRPGPRDLTLVGTPSNEPASGSGDVQVDLGTLLGPAATTELGPQTPAGLAAAIAQLHRPDGVSLAFRTAGAPPPQDPAALSGRTVLREGGLRISGLAALRVRVE
jgi:hypothetical protein